MLIHRHKAVEAVAVEMLMAIYIVWWTPLGFLQLPETTGIMALVFGLNGALWFGLLGLTLNVVRKKMTKAANQAPEDTARKLADPQH